MRVIAEIEYEVSDDATIQQAKEAIKSTPHGSTLSSCPYRAAEYKKVISVRFKKAPK
jgi:hypothetical protein